MKISYSQISQECNELHLLATKLKENMDMIKSLANSLTRNEIWTGSASDYYQKKMNNLLNSYGYIILEIENSILYLAKCSEGYQAVDRMVINQICESLNIIEPNLSTSKFFH